MSFLKKRLREAVEAFDYPKRFKRFAKDLRNLYRDLRGKSDSRISSSLNTQSSARHQVGNTGFRRVYPSIGVRGSYGRK